MKFRGVLGVALLIISVLLGGCLGSDDEQDAFPAGGTLGDQAEEPDAHDADPDPGPVEGQDDVDSEAEEEDGDGGTAGGGGAGGGGSSSSQALPECTQHNNPQPVPPGEQQVDSADQVVCPGHYAVLDEGDGETYPVPSWQVGQWWHYETQVMDQPPTEMRETINGTSDQWGIPVYDVFGENWDEHETPGGNWEAHRSVDSLMQIQRGGAISHEILFPLAENKSWVYMNSARSIVTATVDHVPVFSFQGEDVEAWHIELYIERETGKESIKHLWFGVEERNVLQEELWGADNATAMIQTVDSRLMQWNV